jgi:hypothetical protein
MSTLTEQSRRAVDLVKDRMRAAQLEATPHEYVNHAEASVTVLADVIKQLADQIEATTLARVERPNGKVYRARQIPQAIWLEGTDDVVAVLRTHNVGQAHRLARELEMFSYDLDEIPHRLAWWGKHPTNEGDVAYYDDEVHGVPVVVFGAAS